jgi:hypothetical protein
VVLAAPRYSEPILDAISTLDDREVPIAETCRRVGTVAEKLSLPRPSYVHVRRLIHAHRRREDEERERRAELWRVAADVIYDVHRGVPIDPWKVAERVQRAGR